jgi:hypothetical protein
MEIRFAPCRHLNRRPHGASAGYATWPALALSGSTRPSWLREVMTNRLGEPTNLHLHGLHIPPAADDPARLVAVGDTVVYEFELLPGSAHVLVSPLMATDRSPRSSLPALQGR